MCDEKLNFDKSCDLATHRCGRLNKIHGWLNNPFVYVILNYVKTDTCMKECIVVGKRSAILLQRLGTIDSSCNVGERHGMVENTYLTIVVEFCRLMGEHFEGGFCTIYKSKQVEGYSETN